MKYNQQMEARTMQDMIWAMISFAENEKGTYNKDIVNYGAYVGYADSLYAVNGVDTMADDGTLVISSEDNRAAGPIMTVDNMADIILHAAESADEKQKALPVILERASNLDPDLDMQMTYDCELETIAVDDICHMVVFVAK